MAETNTKAAGAKRAYDAALKSQPPVPKGQDSPSRLGLFGSPAQRQAAVARGRQSSPPSELETNVSSGIEVTRALLRMGYSRAEINKLTPAQVVFHLENQDRLNDYPKGEDDTGDQRLTRGGPARWTPHCVLPGACSGVGDGRVVGASGGES